MDTAHHHFENYSPFKDKTDEEMDNYFQEQEVEDNTHQHENSSSYDSQSFNLEEDLIYEAVKEGVGVYENPDQEHFIKSIIDKTLNFAKQKLIRDTSTFLSPEMNKKATAKNQTLVARSGIKIDDIYTMLEKHLNITLLRVSLLNLNINNPSNPYSVNPLFTEKAVDALFTEAVHQFQIDHFLNTAEHDGVLGNSTMDTLGFVTHGLRDKLASSGFYGQKQLNREDIKLQIPLLTNNDFTAENWYQYIVKPAWLGVKISQGVHSLLFIELREAEKWLLSQAQYKGFTPAELGKALGFHANSQYSGARLSAEKSSMHGFGLAIDIDVQGNPWVGAGWVKNDPKLLKERTRFIDDLRNASGNNDLPGNTIFAYLHSIAESSGANTQSCYAVLKQRNDEFIAYLKNNVEALNYWRSSATFGKRDPLKGFLNLHSDLVFALREIAGLAWGAMDFGPRASGDVMHFDLRTIGFGKFLCGKIKGFVPKENHPALDREVVNDELLNADEFEHHEAIEEDEWEDEIFS